MFSGRKTLSNLEQLVMDVVWERGEVTAEEVRQTLADRHFMKESTARTILRRLEEKGYVDHRELSALARKIARRRSAKEK